MINYKRNVLLGGLIIFLFVSVIGITYSFFSIRTNGNDSASSQMVKSASRLIQYTDLTLISNQEMIPGWSTNKTVDVENLGTKNITYDLIWQSITNNLSRQQDLVYQISCTSNIIGNTCLGKSQTQIPNTGTDISILSSINLAVNEIHTYTITVTYIDQAVDQSVDMNKSISAKLGAKDL